MYRTPLRKLAVGAETTWVRANFGLHKLGDQAPHCSLTGEEYRRPNPIECNLLCCGQISDVIHAAFPELDAFARWHLCTNGIPMHYIANAQYWHEMANGKRERPMSGPDPRATFANHCLIGVIAERGEADDLLAMSWDDCAVVLVNRTPALRAAFKYEVVDKLEEIARKLGAEALG